MDDPVEDRLAVLRLADLQEGRLLRGANEVALGIDEEKLGRSASDLTSENERGFGSEAGAADLGVVSLFLCVRNPTQIFGDVGHRWRSDDVDRRLVGNIAIELGNYRLGGREVTRGEEGDLTFSLSPKGVHLPVGGHLVGPGVRPGIRGEDDARFDRDGNAVGHVGDPVERESGESFPGSGSR